MPLKVGYKELIIIDPFNLVVWRSKQYAMLLGSDVSVTKIYFLVILIEDIDIEGLGRRI